MLAPRAPTYEDLLPLSEDERIELLGEAAENGLLITFLVDNKRKANRYLKKLRARHHVRLVKKEPGPIPASVTVCIGPLIH